MTGVAVPATALPGSLPARGTTRFELAAAGVVALLVAAVFLGLAWFHGAIGAARNDDWVYLRSAYDFAAHGDFIADSWTMTMLVGQTVLAAPVIAVFGAQIAPLQVLVAVLGAVGLWATYGAIRSVLPPGWSAFSVLTLAVGPLFGSLATSFMTDVPAFGFQSVTIWAGILALRDGGVRTKWYLVSLAAGLAAFSVREYAASAGAAVIVAAFLTSDRPLGRAWRVWAPAGGWFVASAALMLWRRTLVDGGGATFATPDGQSVAVLFRTAVTVAVFVLPVVPLLSLRRLAASSRRRWGPLLALGALAVAAHLILGARGSSRLLGNYVTQSGSYSVTLPGEPPRLPTLAWGAMEVAGLVGLFVLLALGATRLQAAVTRRAGPQDPGRPADSANGAVQGRRVLEFYAAFTLGGIMAVALVTTAPTFDRYLMPVIPTMTALVLRIALDHDLLVRWKRVGAVVSLAAFGLVGLAFVDNAATFDGAKWRLAQAVEDAGYRAETIDGGYEWFGYHQPGPISPGNEETGLTFWTGLFDDATVCVTSAYASPDAGGPVSAMGSPIATATATSLLGLTYDLVALPGPESCGPVGPSRG